MLQTIDAHQKAKVLSEMATIERMCVPSASASSTALLLLISSSTLLVGNAQQQSTVQATIPASVTIGATKSCPKTVSSMSHALTCKFVPLSNDDLQVLKDATSDLNKVLASSEFKDAVLVAKFTETEGKTNQQIYDLIVTSSTIHLDITLYKGGWVLNKWDKNQGFEDDSAPNVCFGNRYAIQGRRGFLGSLMLHESMHVLGFHHYDDPVTSSVPYTMNTIYDQVAQKLGLSTSFADAQ